MADYGLIVIGGGAAGLCAAISAARRGRSVLICEKTPFIGKKLLATGNGRCNIFNSSLDAARFNPASRELVRSVFAQFGQPQIQAFFAELGLHFSTVEGRVYPVTFQAASVLKVLEMELERLRVPLELSFECCAIDFVGRAVKVISRARKEITGEKVVLAGGGKSYPSFGSNGSLFELARALGHSVVEPVPCAVPLVVKDRLCQELQGQRIAARVRSLIGGREGKAAAGDLLFTRYGLSGTAILDVSEEISLALNRERRSDVWLEVDLVPFLDRSQLKKAISQRQAAGWLPQDLLVGILPNRFGLVLRGFFAENEVEGIIDGLKARRFRVISTKSWNEAEFTAGGISLTEVNRSNLESKLHANLYFAGEMLDVNGERGGYNLAWAWASGLLAGETR